MLSISTAERAEASASFNAWRLHSSVAAEFSASRLDWAVLQCAAVAVNCVHPLRVDSGSDVSAAKPLSQEVFELLYLIAMKSQHLREVRVQP